MPSDIDGYVIVDTNSATFKQLIESSNIWGQFHGKKNQKDKWYEHKIEFYIESLVIFIISLHIPEMELSEEL